MAGNVEAKKFVEETGGKNSVKDLSQGVQEEIVWAVEKIEDQLPALSEVFSEYRLRGIESWNEVAQLGKSNIRELWELKSSENSGKLSKKMNESVLDYLKHLEQNSPEKPYLLSLTPYNYFEEGDEVLVYLGHIEPTSRPIKEDWVPAKVVEGYRHQDGFVNYKTEIPVHDNLEYNEGKGGFCGMGRPEVLKKEDFEGLREAAKTDPAFFELWCKNIPDYLRDFDLPSFKSSLATWSIASAIK